MTHTARKRLLGCDVLTAAHPGFTSVKELVSFTSLIHPATVRS